MESTFLHRRLTPALLKAAAASEERCVDVCALSSRDSVLIAMQFHARSIRRGQSVTPTDPIARKATELSHAPVRSHGAVARAGQIVSNDTNSHYVKVISTLDDAGP